mmetsp:Transcript_5985/g.6535  ORF Transcript_5985/g.6535 Transcript_5985/m.6535 type:complete len:126 (-) Transcript_5985:872-1249(-)
MEQKTGKDAEQKKDEKPHVVKVRKDKDGTIYAFNEEHQVWMPEVDADDIQAQQSAYQYVDPDKAPPAPSAEAKPKDANKRKRTVRATQPSPCLANIQANTILYTQRIEKEEACTKPWRVCVWIAA